MTQEQSGASSIVPAQIEQPNISLTVPTRSLSIGKLAEALSKAQGEFDHAKKDVKNDFFKSRYADLASVIDAAKKSLAANNLAVFQPTNFNDKGQFILLTILAHASGEWISGVYPISPVKNDPQGMGSALTYARRYSFSAITGIASDDDDGNAASGNGQPEAKVKSVFSNSAKRKEFCENVKSAYESAPTMDALKMARSQYAEQFLKMRNNGDEYDGMAVDEANKQYERAKHLFENPYLGDENEGK